MINDVKEQWYGHNICLVCHISGTEPGPLNADVRVRRINSDGNPVIAALESWYEKHEMMDFLDWLVETNWLPSVIIMGTLDRTVTDASLERALAEWRQMEEDRQVRNPADVIPE